MASRSEVFCCNKLSSPQAMPWDAWSFFVQDVRSLAPFSYGIFHVTGNAFSIASPFHDVLRMEFGQTKVHCNISYKNTAFLRTIASIFLLYNRWYPDNLDMFFGGSWEDVQDGVNDLRAARIFQEDFPYILPWTDILTTELNTIRSRIIRTVLRDFGFMPGRKDPAKLSAAIYQAVTESALYQRPGNMRASDIIRILCERDFLQRLSLIYLCIDQEIYWFAGIRHLQELFPYLCENGKAKPVHEMIRGKFTHLEIIPFSRLQSLPDD